MLVKKKKSSNLKIQNDRKQKTKINMYDANTNPK